MKKKIAYTKTESGSYLHNCYVKHRAGDLSTTLFSDNNKRTQFCLNGYAIVPLEDAKSIYPDIIIKKADIEEADRQLVLL